MIPAEDRRPVSILLVEDNPGDALLLRIALREAELDHRIEVVGTGEQALEVLHRAVEEGKVTPPDLVLLDLRLPGIDGLEVLRDLRRHPRLASIPTVVVSWSRGEGEEKQVEQLGATAFLPKAQNLREFLRLGRSIADLCQSIRRVERDGA